MTEGQRKIKDEHTLGVKCLFSYLKSRRHVYRIQQQKVWTTCFSFTSLTCQSLAVFFSLHSIASSLLWLLPRFLFTRLVQNLQRKSKEEERERGRERETRKTFFDFESSLRRTTRICSTDSWIGCYCMILPALSFHSLHTLWMYFPSHDCSQGTCSQEWKGTIDRIVEKNLSVERSYTRSFPLKDCPMRILK